MTSYNEFHRRSIEDRDGFWREQAQLIDWHKQPQEICDYSRPPFVKWFKGGETNLCYNAVDRHAEKRPNDKALIYISTETDEEKVYSFAELQREVERMAAIYQDLGVKRGDRVLIYMPMIAEAAFAMLACARIGAIHSVVLAALPPDHSRRASTTLHRSEWSRPTPACATASPCRTNIWWTKPASWPPIRRRRC